MLCSCLVLDSSAASAGLVFRESEVREFAGAPSVREVWQFSAQDGGMRALLEASDDPLLPAGCYLLATTTDAFVVDPARRLRAPFVPSDLRPAAAEAAESVSGRQLSALAVRREFEERGPVMLGLPTWHYVYLLSYQEASAGEPPLHFEERHEFWAAALPDAQADLAAWRELRLIEDGGAGAARRPLREALAGMLDLGLFMRHVVERREWPGAAVPPAVPWTERVQREITAISREDLDATLFDPPAGLAEAEFLAPAADERASRP
jgi:hypothetical protein